MEMSPEAQQQTGGSAGGRCLSGHRVMCGCLHRDVLKDFDSSGCWFSDSILGCSGVFYEWEFLLIGKPFHVHGQFKCRGADICRCALVTGINLVPLYI